MRTEPRGISSLAEGKGKKRKLGDKARAGRGRRTRGVEKARVVNRVKQRRTETGPSDLLSSK